MREPLYFTYNLFNKGDSFPFSFIRIPHIEINIPQNIFCSGIKSEFWRIVSSTICLWGFISFYSRLNFLLLFSYLYSYLLVLLLHLLFLSFYLITIIFIIISLFYISWLLILLFLLKLSNYTKSVLLMLSQPRLLTFLFCEYSYYLKNMQLYTVLELYKVIRDIQ